MPRTAIVTGAARGLGKSIALRLASDGYDVCVNDIEANKAMLDEVAKEIASMGRKSLSYIADVSSRAAVAAMITSSVEKLGNLHTMVANAGIVQVKNCLDITEEDVQRMFSVNLFGVFNCYQEAAKQMIKQGPLQPQNYQTVHAEDKNAPGRYKIIGCASVAAFQPFPLLAHYCSSKWAVRGLTHGFAMEMAPHNITVNAYAPGIVDTPMWELIDAEIGKIRGVPQGETLKQYSANKVILGRTSVPADVARTLGFLASSDSDYMTGQTIVIDGGIQYT